MAKAVERHCLFTPASSVIMCEQEVPVSVMQRINIKFLTQEGVKFLRRWTEHFREGTLWRVRVLIWHKQFLEGRERVDNESHDRRPRTSITDNEILRVQQLLELKFGKGKTRLGITLLPLIWWNLGASFLRRFKEK